MKTKDSIIESEIIESVFAFKKGSIDTSFMVGEELPPLNTFKPTIKNLFLDYFSPDNGHSKKNTSTSEVFNP